jgi:hypothetical protein
MSKQKETTVPGRTSAQRRQELVELLVADFPNTQLGLMLLEDGGDVEKECAQYRSDLEACRSWRAIVDVVGGLFEQSQEEDIAYIADVAFGG